jgi:hypothetical protein
MSSGGGDARLFARVRTHPVLFAFLSDDTFGRLPPQLQIYHSLSAKEYLQG